MSKHCVNHNSPEVQELAANLGLHPGIVAAKIGVWQEENNTEDIPNIDQLTKTTGLASPETIKRLKDFLIRIGVDIESVNDIVIDGQKVDANGVANLTQKLIQVVQGKEASALPEEAMHFAVEIIQQKDPALFKKLLSEINGTNTLREVNRDYANNPNYQTKDGKPDVLKLKKEAIGKLLAAVVVNRAEGTMETRETLAKGESMWNRILQFIKNLFSTSGFDQASMDILSGKDIGKYTNITSNRPDVILPIGTSGSGKSTFINSLPKDNLVIIEPDSMRVEFTGDMNDKSKDNEIYIEAAKRAVSAIKNGKQVVFDTTNLTKEKRLPFINAIKKEIPEANIQYKLMELNPELAKKRIKAQLARGENRANVSDDTIDRHAVSYKKMLEEIKHEPITEYQNSEVMYQLSDPSPQDRIFDSMKTMSESIEKTETGYAINGKPIKTRVSNLIKDWYDRRFSDKSLVQSDYTTAVNDLKAERGTAGHADLEHVFDLYVDSTTGLLREVPLDDTGYVSLINPNNNTMYDILKENLKNRLHSFPAGTKFMSEITIYDSKRDIAGTVDFLAISPEGKVSILDWKFMDLNINKYTDIPWYKVNAWNMQMEQYKYIISKVYGVKNENFGQTRMIPIKAFYTEGNVKKDILPALQSIRIGDVNVKNITEDYLLPVGIEGEKTGNKKIDTLVEKLNAIYKKLSEEKVTPETKGAKAEQLNALFSAIRQLQMKQNIAPLVHQAKILNKQIQSIVDEYNNRFKGVDKSNFTERQISDFSEKLELGIESLKTYTNLDTELKFLFMGELSEEDKELREDLRDTVDNAREYADILGGEDGIDQEFITTFIGSTASAEKVITGITKFFGNTATIQLKALDTLFKKAHNASTLASMDTGDEVRRLSKLKDEYQKWAKNKGLKISEQFDILKKKNSNELINEFNKEFYSEMKSKIDEKDFKWIIENTDTAAYKDYLTEKREYEYKLIEDKHRVGTEDVIDRQIKNEKSKVDALYNTSTPTSPGWLLYNDIKKFPKKELWESKEWKELHKPENKPALDFYNYIIEKNKEYTDIGYINAEHTRTFLPWVRKGFTEKVIFGGKVSLGEEFLRSISMDEGDTGYGKIDPLTGKPIDTIPKYLTTKIDGEVSTDLFKTMAMYNEFALKFKYMSEIEAQGRALIRLEKNKKAIATSIFGKTEYKDGVLQYNPDNTVNTKIVEDMVKAIIYQQKYIQSDTFDQVLTTLGNTGEKINNKLGFKLLPEDMAGKQVSVNKIITQLNNNFQIMTLGLNPLSSISNLFGGKTQSFINSGKYFTKEDFVTTEAWLLQNRLGGPNRAKMLAALEYFMPFTDNYNRDASKDLSLSNLTDEHVQDYLMFMMRNSEEAVQKTNFFSYLRNSSVIDGRIVNTREYLRTTPKYSNMYKGTTEEMNALKVEFEKDVKEQNETNGVIALGTEVDGVFTIPGIDRKSESVIELRRKVQQFTSDALGSLTEENKRLVNLNIYGKSFMVFKNWIPRLVDVRMGNLKYNAASDAYEWGRSRMFYRIISEDLLGSINNLTNTLKGNEKGADFLRKLYEKKRTDYETDTGKELEMTEDQFIELVRQNTKNQMIDLLFYAGLIALTLGIKALPPDDDEDPLVKNHYKFLLKATDKLKDEIGYFYDPTSLTSLISGSIFPSIKMLDNYKKALINFLIENYALATGDEKLAEKTHTIKYWMKSFKWTNQTSQLLPMFSPEMAKDLGIEMKSQYGVK